jgi:RIO-like serine/threonine protein kinase
MMKNFEYLLEKDLENVEVYFVKNEIVEEKKIELIYFLQF